jgi:hypothetical protein
VHGLLVKDGKDLSETRAAAPVTHEITDDSKVAHESNTSTLHAAVGILSELDVEGAASISVGEDFVSGINKRQSQEGGA